MEELTNQNTDENENEEVVKHNEVSKPTNGLRGKDNYFNNYRFSCTKKRLTLFNF